MIPRPAQYLLRFDDLCPTFCRVKWERFLPLMEEFRIRPILAVVPDNRDPGLVVSGPDDEFWTKMRAMEAAGAAIALHGYQHLCNSRGGGLLPLHRRTEFAGVSQEIQRDWIHAGIETLRGHGLTPQLWVAPRHGFDRNTLRALKLEGIDYLSDGLGRIPICRCGVTCIPQQLWEPVYQSRGLWTICIHSNFAGGGLLERLRVFLRRYATHFTSFDRVVAEYRPVKFELGERVYERLCLLRLQMSRRKQWGTRQRAST